MERKTPRNFQSYVGVGTEQTLINLQCYKLARYFFAQKANGILVTRKEYIIWLQISSAAAIPNINKNLSTFDGVFTKIKG